MADQTNPRLHQVLSRFLQPIVENVFKPYEQISTSLRDDIASLERLELELHEANQALQKKIARLPITGMHTIDQAWNFHPDAQLVFASYGLPACNYCSVRFDETIDEATMAYGISKVNLLKDLNRLRDVSSKKC